MRKAILLVLTLFGTALTAQAQTQLSSDSNSLETADQIGALQRENDNLHQRIAELVAEVEDLKKKLQTLESASGSTSTVTVPPPPAGPDYSIPPTLLPSVPTLKVTNDTQPVLASPSKLDEKISSDNDTMAKVRHSLWKHEISLGGSLNSGNTNSYAIRLREKSDRTTPLDSYHLGLLGEFKSVEYQTVTDRAKGDLQYNRNLTSRFYAFGQSSALTDEVLELTYRLQLGPGLGYYLIKNDSLTFALESGPAGQAEKYQQLPEHNTLQGRGVDHLEWTIAPRLHFYQKSELLSDVNDPSSYQVNFETGFRSSVVEKLSLQLSFEDQYESTPPDGKKRNDLGLITSLVWDF